MSLLLRSLIRLLARLPLPVLHNVGALAGWLTYLASPRYRAQLTGNIRSAGLDHARFAAVAEAGKGILELPRIWLGREDDVAAEVARVTGWELVEEAWRSNRGILFLTPHLGCFEITAQYYARWRPITVLYRPPRKAWLRPIVERGRGANLRLAPADVSGVRKLVRALKHHEAVGMLPDQVPTAGEGVWAPFFGRPAYTMTLAARLAESGATVLFAYAERLPYGAGFHLRLNAPAEPLTGTLEERVSRLNSELEALVRECPGQYLWAYNRYKAPAGAAAKPRPAPAEHADGAAR